MFGEQMSAALVLLGDGGGRHGTRVVSEVAARAADALGVDGISAGVGTGSQGVVLVWGRDSLGAALEDVQFTLGQGPGLDAVADGVSVLVADLEEQVARWPGFVPGALELKVRAVFAFPLRIGAISVGVLTAYRAAPGPMTGEQVADALTLADAVTVLLLHRQQPRGYGAGIGRGGPQPGWEQPPTYRAEVHQATGMISVQLDVSLAEALVRLRAHAYARDRPVAEIAAAVVGRRLRFEEPGRKQP